MRSRIAQKPSKDLYRISVWNFYRVSRSSLGGMGVKLRAPRGVKSAHAVFSIEGFKGAASVGPPLMPRGGPIEFSR